MIKETPLKNRLLALLGWAAVAITTILISFWAFWGIIENFHEGWWFVSVWENLGVMLVQYLALMLIFYILGILAMWKNKIGTCAFFSMSVSVFFFFDSGAGRLFAALPLVILAVLWWFAKPEPRRWAWRIILWFAPIVMVVSGAEPFYRVVLIGRTNDGNFGERTVRGNNVQLSWAPSGPGFPDKGTSWFEANRICAHLSSDGTTLLDSVVNYWRLPTINEAVRSLTRYGNNSGGVWDSLTQKASYSIMPDKETPLWNPHKQIIYWWTASETDALHAYRIVYNGQVWTTAKKDHPAYYGFRAVRNR